MAVHHFDSDELRRLLEVAANQTAHARRDVAMVVLSFRHGLRACEVTGLTLADFDEENNRLVVRAAKSRRKNGIEYYEMLRPKDSIAAADATVVHAWLREREERYPNGTASDALFLSRKGDGLLPRSWFKVFATIAKTAGLRKELCHPHVLRHTCAMAGIAANTPLPVISAVLRHKSIASLSPYVAVTQKEADCLITKAFAKF